MKAGALPSTAADSACLGYTEFIKQHDVKSSTGGNGAIQRPGEGEIMAWAPHAHGTRTCSVSSQSALRVR